MTDFLVTVLSFAVAIGVLIAVHEFGHFWVARRMGVKVLRFSIGFGKPLWTRRGRHDGTEYVIAAIPLGGYVKMLDEREAPVPEAEVARAFNRQPVPKRLAIVAAGPIFNLLFAVFAYWAMFVTGVPGLRPLLGDVAPESLAYAAGLREEQEVVAVGETPTPTWGSVWESVLPYALRKEPVVISVNDEGATRHYTLPLDRLQGTVDPASLAKEVGLTPYHPRILPVIGEVAVNSAAQQAGLLPGDKVLAIDGKEITEWEQLVDTVHDHPDTTLRFTIRRDGSEHAIDVRPAAVVGKEGKFGRIGAGVNLDEAVLLRLRTEWRLGPLAAVGAALEKTWDMSALTLRMMGEMVVGQASVQNISGPITIAQYAKSSAVAGLAPFLGFLAIVSVSLGVLNLLPIPVLDGGHLLFFLVEAMLGRAVSERTQAVATRVGLAMLVLLMTIALYNDVTRLVGGE